MTKRRIETHEACLTSFSQALKREVKQNLGTWKKLDPKQASARRQAYSNIVCLLKQEAEAHNIPLADLGLVDYEVPEVE